MIMHDRGRATARGREVPPLTEGVACALSQMPTSDQNAMIVRASLHVTMSVTVDNVVKICRVHGIAEDDIVALLRWMGVLYPRLHVRKNAHARRAAELRMNILA